MERENVPKGNYKNPPIPTGYRYLKGNWENGYVIQRTTDDSQFVWIPVGLLKSNGTLDGVSFKEKFGRRICSLEDEFSADGFNEPINQELKEQTESIIKYGGFYYSRYNISISSKGLLQSRKGFLPYTDLIWDEAKELASAFEHNEFVKSHLTYGAEYDSVLQWLVDSCEKSFFEIAGDSSNWGNFGTYEIKKTGSNKEFRANKIYDIAGNVAEFTQELNSDYGFCTVRGGNCNEKGTFSAAFREMLSISEKSKYIGFRISLWIK